ncbi:MAG: polysaccharide pyruvyl transferase family protein [Planctomycetota bacterium]|jgi:polysaccharide pyruvyl transferase WcaK-like protein
MTTSTKPLFIVFGNGPFQNHGCEAILRSTIDLLQDEFGPCRFINSMPYEYTVEFANDLGAEITHQVPKTPPGKPIRKFHPAWFAHQFKKRFCTPPQELFEPYLAEAGAMLCLGGDNFSLDYGYPERYFVGNRAAFRHGKPVVIWGASVGPFTRKRRFERYAAGELKKVSLICARETETVKYLKSIGISDNVRQVADPAFLLKPLPVDDDSLIPTISEQSCIGINFSPLMARYQHPDRNWLKCAAKCIEEMLARFDRPIILIPHVAHPGNDDHAFMQMLVSHLNINHDRLLLVGPDYNAQQLKWIIAKMSVFIGCRTHSTIAALSSCVPTLSIGYSIKSVGINKDIFGHTDWTIPSNELTPDNLCEKTASLLDAQAEVRDHLDNIMPSYRDKARQAAVYLKDLLSG